MEIYKIENLSFSYPGCENKALDGVNLSVLKGEFVTICGKSGCGKTTLLRHLKSSLTPAGEIDGKVYFNNTPINAIDKVFEAEKIGFVMQNPEAQIACDKVWHELAFGLESLGYSTGEMKVKIAEMASFFGIESWFYKKTTELSGGQKQILNLASVMVLSPAVIILDEPTSQLDPIAAGEFLKMLKRVNLELGTTIIISEHRLEDVIPVSDRVVVLDDGKIVADGTPEMIGKILKETENDMYIALPAAMRIYGAVDSGFNYPKTIRDGRKWLEEYAENKTLEFKAIEDENQGTPLIEVKDVWFRYEKELDDIVKGLSFTVNKGEIFAILGGNGVGKTTALSLISGINTPYRGKVLIDGVDVGKIKNLYTDILGVLPQNPETLFVKNTVYLDLKEALADKALTSEEVNEKIGCVASICRIEKILNRHPYDLSGGEKQRAALAKVLLKNPEILLLDEPTKGLDAHFKMIFADILNDLKANGVTIIMVSHDIEFCAEFTDRCALFFDGNITAVGSPRKIFAGNSFYTTSVSRMAREIIPGAILVNDVLSACGAKVTERKTTKIEKFVYQKENKEIEPKTKKKLSPIRLVSGGLSLACFVILCILQKNMVTNLDINAFQLCCAILMGICFMCILPERPDNKNAKVSDTRLEKHTLFAMLFILVAIPLTILFGIYFLGDRKYYFISLLIILETIIPFLMIFEKRKPMAREVVVISVLCALAVAGRTAFFMLPQFKPVVAIIIISGVCFGAETGFLVGAVTGFVSNIFFGQGPWTPWHMFTFGMVGFVAGILFKKGFIRKKRMSLSVFGFFVTVIVYGGIINPASVLMWQPKPTLDMIISAYVFGLPYDLIHAVSTSFFLWFISEPMIEKIERIKAKHNFSLK